MFLLLTLNIFKNISSVSIVDFEQENVSWEVMLAGIPFFDFKLKQKRKARNVLKTPFYMFFKANIETTHFFFSQMSLPNY